MLKEIQKQPEHIREIFMWLCVTIVFSFVLLTGFRQTEERLVALVNPKLQENTSQLANKKETSPFAVLGGYIGELRASITDIFNFNFSQSAQEVKNVNSEKEIPPALLPLAGDK